MSRVGSVFVREVNVAIGGMLAAVVILASAHYVSVVHEMRHMRQQLCAANIALIASRNPYLRLEPPPEDACAALSTLTGQVMTPVAVRNRRGA